MTDSRSGTEIYKISLEHLVIPDSQESSRTARVMTKVLKGQLERNPTSQGWDNLNFNNNCNGLKLIIREETFKMAEE